jgi:hypothetical protein
MFVSHNLKEANLSFGQLKIRTSDNVSVQKIRFLALGFLRTSLICGFRSITRFFGSWYSHFFTDINTVITVQRSAEHLKIVPL